MSDRICEICKTFVCVQSHHVSSGGKFWHFECYKAQKKIDEYYAKWQEVIERLKDCNMRQQLRENYERKD